MAPAIAFVGKSNSGKTTLVEKLIREFKARGYRVASIKHTDKAIETDVEGKDSWRFTQAGSDACALVTSLGITVFRKGPKKPTIEEALSALGDSYDLVIVEGFKGYSLPRIEVFNGSRVGDMACQQDELLAVVSDRKLRVKLPRFERSDVRGVADFVEKQIIKGVKHAHRDQTVKIKAGVLTVSDKGSRGERQDASGELIRQEFARQGITLSQYEVIPDEIETISATLKQWADKSRLDLVFTTGGTGLAPRDVTPEATLAVIEKEVPGIIDIMRSSAFSRTPNAVLSRAVAGVRGKCLIINLPGSPGGVKDNLTEVLPALKHGLAKLCGDMSDCAAPYPGKSGGEKG